jgi:Tol biopolymer transport system component
MEGGVDMGRPARFLSTTIVALVAGGYVGVEPAEAGPARTTRVSVDINGGDANGVSGSPSISGDGRYVAFESAATDIAPGDVPDDVDVFVRDRAMGTSTPVCVDAGGGVPNGGCASPSISADGRYVAFASNASDLVAGDVDDPFTDIFVRDLVTEVTERVSVTTAGDAADGSSDRPSISGDGRVVAFNSNAPNLGTVELGGPRNVIVRDLVAGITVQANIDAAGGAPLTGAEIGVRLFSDSPNALSDDGRFVVFESAAPDLVAGDITNVHDIFVRDLFAGVTTLVSDAPEVKVVMNATISGDGRLVAFTNADFGLIRGGDVLVRNLVTGETTQANVGTGDPASFSFSTPSFSRDGRHLAFDSTPVNMAAGENTPLDSNIFVRDLEGRTTRRVSLTADGGAPNGSSFDPALSSDGRAVAYVSGASDLVVEDGNGLRDVFVADLDVPTVRERLVALGDLIASFELQHGIADSLTAKVHAALAGLDRGNIAGACGTLDALANEVRAQAGMALTQSQSEQVIAEVGHIRDLLVC